MIPRLILIPLLIRMAAATAASALAQDQGRQSKAAAPLANPNDPKIARRIWSAASAAGAMPTRVLGFLCPCCIAGAEGLPPTRQRQVCGCRASYWAIPIWSRGERLPEGATRTPAAWHLERRLSQAARGPILPGHASISVGSDRRILLRHADPEIVHARTRGDVGRQMCAKTARRRYQVVNPGHRRHPRLAARSPTVHGIFVNPRSRKRCAAKPRAIATASQGAGRCTATTITATSASNARPSRRCESQPDSAKRRLQRRRSRLLVQESVLHQSVQMTPKPNPDDMASLRRLSGLSAPRQPAYQRIRKVRADLWATVPGLDEGSTLPGASLLLFAFRYPAT